MKRGLKLSTKEARQLVKLLGEYQGILEDDIAGNLLQDGSTMPNDPDASDHVAQCRRNWKRAEDWVKRLSGERLEPSVKPPATLQPKIQKANP